MDRIVPKAENTGSPVDIAESTKQQGSASNISPGEAVAIDHAILPGNVEPAVTSHLCHCCGQTISPGGKIEDQKTKIVRQSRRKRTPIRRGKSRKVDLAVSSDSDNDISSSPTRSSRSSRSYSSSSYYNSSVENVSGGQNLDTLDGNPMPERLDILYKVKCSEKGQLDKTFYSATQFSGLEVHKVDADQASVIEIISGVKGKSLVPKLKGQSKTKFQQNSQREGIKFGEDFVISSIKTTSLVVHSEALQDALRHVVKYYPSQTMTGGKITFKHPYEPLFVYFERIKAYKHDLENGYNISDEPRAPTKSSATGKVTGVLSGPSPGSISTPMAPTQTSASLQPTGESPKDLTLEESTAHDLGVLLNFLAPEYENSIQPEKLLHSRGLASYKMLWLLLEPGSEVYALMDGQYAAFVVTAVSEQGHFDTGSVQVTVWSLASAGDKIFRKEHLYEIIEFGGEREITSLEVFPCKYLDEQDGGKTRTNLELRGQRYYDILREYPLHMAYSGPTLDEKPITYRGQIIADPKGYLKHARELQPQQRSGPPPPPPPPGYIRRTPHFAYGCYAKSDDDREKPGDIGGKEKWKDYNDIDPTDDNHSVLTPHHYRLFPQYFLGFALKVKVWMIFDIDNITPVIWPSEADDPMRYLVLPKRDKDIVQALSKKFERGKEITWSADFIEDKGAGQVFLLHGPPGTGKTYTVECVAKYAQRPLLPLTVADIGTEESSVQAKLDKWFDLGEKWGAILLIDEADVFLESRTTASLQRNSLVSVFLRTMEYYTGMLFLTTNRMGQIDDAFLSRIQVALGYSKLSNDAQMSIWEGFFEKLEDERSDIVISQRAKTFVLTDEKFRTMGWNGREIRNALHTAIALATHDKKKRTQRGSRIDDSADIEINEKHFEQLRERREVFIAYRNSIDRRTEEQRAAAAKDRARLND